MRTNDKKSDLTEYLKRRALTSKCKRSLSTLCVYSCLALVSASGVPVAFGQAVNYTTPGSFTSVGLKAPRASVGMNATGVEQSVIPSRPVTGQGYAAPSNVAYRSVRPAVAPTPGVNTSAPVQPQAGSYAQVSARQTSQGVVQTSIQIPQSGASSATAVRIADTQLGSSQVYAGNYRPTTGQGVITGSVPYYQAASVAQHYSQQAQVETLEEATRIALTESRSQRALALKNGASRSDVAAARSLRNPKISNTTSYTGILNQPTTVFGADWSAEANALKEKFPDLAPIISKFPTHLDVDVPIADKDFVTTVTAVTLPIYLGGRITALTRAAEALAQATAAGEDVGEQTVKLQVAEAYFLVLRTRQLRQVAIEAVQTAEGHCQDAEKMYNVGLLTRNVVLAAQVALSETRQTELKVANAQQLAESAYNRLLWRPLDAPVSIADVELGAPMGDLDALTVQAVRSRGELQVLAAEARALQEQEKVARADVLPQVAAVGSYSYFENSHLRDNSNATAAIGMTWTPIDGGTSRARQNAARQNAMAMARVRDEAESSVRLQVRQAWLAEQEARQRVEVARIAVDQAEENLRVVTRGFQEGAVNHTETLDAATMCAAAKSNYANARYDAILAAQRLRCAAGIL